jgi:Stress responsive A/B Barrel Domain
MKNIFGYSKAVFVFCAFLMVVYGAYTPSQKAEYQMIFCVKFKNTVSPEEIQKHLVSFMALRKDIPEIVHVSAGKTLTNNEYDAMYYLTFRNKDGVDTYQNSESRRLFVAANASKWAKTLTVESEIAK